MTDYLKDGPAIYKQSFATIRAEASLDRFDPIVERVAVRAIHACGMVDLADEIETSANFGSSAMDALRSGAPILCDTWMVASGVTRLRLPADNEVVCTLRDERVVGLAADLGTTRTAAAVELWRDQLDGAVVAIGNAPTALFHLLDMIDDGAPAPAAVIGVPVGFVGAVESKDALAARGGSPEFVIVRGRRGGSAVAAAVVNALASDVE